MTVTIESGGRRRRVDVRRGPGEDRWLVAVDGLERAVRVAAGPEGWSLLLGAAGSERYDSHEVRIERRGHGELDVHLRGSVVVVSIDDERRGRAAVRRPGVAVDGVVTVTAPMPGRIVKVLVQPGQAVEASQGLIVVEAMKMENELRAPAAGIVREVRATPGASVEARAVLVIVDVSA